MIKLKFISIISIFLILKTKKDEKSQNDECKENTLLCRFVLDGLGAEIGESIALDNDIIIIKNGKKYLGIPLKHVEEKEDKLIVKGLVDKRNAIQMGESWRDSYLKK